MARQNEPAITTNLPHIPPFAKPLAPYIKSRQEALHIRQALTCHLRSHITFVNNDLENPDCHAQSHLSLCVSENAVSDVKHIPAEFTGSRKEYLQALQANVAARKQYQLISEKLATEGRSEKPIGVGRTSPDYTLELQAYLRLVRDRRRLAKLQVFEHYLHELRARDTPSPEDFENQDARNQLALSAEFEDESQNDNVAGSDIEGLVHKLERAVIRAKSQLDREKKLYEDLKARNVSDSLQTAPPSVKVAALQRTRDELVQWVEEKLIGSGNSEEAPVQELPAEEIEESARILEEQRLQIIEKYAAYTETRKRLLEAAARACQPVSTASTKSPRQPPDLRGVPTDESLPIEPLEVLSFATNVLHPLSKGQRFLSLQNFYLAGMLAKEKSTTLRILNRLSDESHLLPEYPILARQPRFKHAAGALNSRHATNQPDPAKQDPIVSMAEAWAFASAAAGSGEKEYVEQKVAKGSDRAKQAQKEMQRVYDLLNQKLEEALEDDQSEEQRGSDIWAYEARSTRSRAKSTRTDTRLKGPWACLNGRVGFED
ncbi:hypothetical protein BDW59DRAFT_45890 [Aspergillus cavernicola]|uniref:Uncharacterized protein n=1 Tax=Aspergillus cavernicola TaxID=176166 RepID=A0ABR4J2M5_9EURO